MGIIGGQGASSIGGFLGGSNGAEEDDEKWDARISLAPLMATLLLPILIGAILVVKCVYGHCCARKTSTKEEMYGVEGRMTMLTNSDAAYLTSPSASSANFVPTTDNPTTTAVIPLFRQTQAHQNKMEFTKSNTANNNAKTEGFTTNNNPDIPIVVTNDIVINPLSASAEFPSLVHRSECDLTDTLRRATGKRQLPDLPDLPQHSMGHPPRRSSSVLSHDGTSELYATVGEVPNPYAQLKARHSVPNDACQPSTSRGGRSKGNASDFSGVQKNSLEPNPSSDSETYASSVHPYAKLKRNSAEHPYARVRNASLNDEETDTDNYDMPQPYAQTRGRTNGAGAAGNVPQQGSSTSAAPGNGGNGAGPVPPRRIGRQWRRGSQPQTSVDSGTHFSGDSQDSRGYTSISVREPLSNIRSQVAGGRTGDSHYATVSDDSEEMYAAIDDASVDGNYMQIPEGERPNRPSWLDSTNVASPIPERREANSPLPPVPAVPPPQLLEGGGVAVSPIGSPSLAHPPPQTPPVYAQVTKKNKKSKAPVTPTASNASTSSQQTFGRDQPEEEPGGTTLDHNNVVALPVASSSSSGPGTSTHHNSHHHQNHHRSKSRTLMDNTNLLESNISEHRRWSKADISYSEFEIVRENFVPSPSAAPAPPSLMELNKSPVAFTLSSSSNSERIHSQQQHHPPVSPRESISSRHSIISQHNELLDEDNYNVIPDKRTSNSNSEQLTNRRSGSGGRSRVDSDNYQEIEPISNTYQEIGKQSSSDYYQEIGAPLERNGSGGDIDDQDDSGSGLYQVIRKGGPKGGDNDEYDEEEEEDQFYEKVRPSTTTSLTIPHPSGRKHGYEKIKRKVKSPSPQPKSGSARGTSDDDDEEEGRGEDEEDLMYEKVKYPPYERLKESRSDLAVNASSIDDDEDDEGNNFYERVKAKNGKAKVVSNTPTKNKEPVVEVPDETVDLNQLYAVIDKSKKKGKGSSGSTSIRSSSTSANNNNPQNFNNNNPSPINNLSSSSRSPYSTSRFASTSTNSPNTTTTATSKVGLSLHSDIDFIDDNNEIEYI